MHRYDAYFIGDQFILLIDGQYHNTHPRLGSRTLTPAGLRLLGWNVWEII